MPTRRLVAARLLVLVSVALLGACAAPTADGPNAAKPEAAATGAAPAGAATAAPFSPPSGSASPAVSAGRTGPAPLPTPATVRVGDLRITSSAGTYIALDRGYFAEQGIQVEFEPFSTGGEQVAPLASGQLDVGVGAVAAALFNAVGRGVPLKLVADQGRNLPGRSSSTAAVRRDLADAIRTPADLRGRTFALSGTANTPEIQLDRLLALGGLTRQDLTVVILPFPEMAAGFANRAIDVSLYNEPFTTRAVDSGLIVRWLGADEFYFNQQNGVLMFGPNMVGNVELARRYIYGYLRGVRDYLAAFDHGEGREEVIRILIDHTTVKERDLFDRMTPSGLGPNGYLNVQSLQDDMQWFLAQGYIQQPVDIGALVDHQYVDWALGTLGRVAE